jgi:peptide/nickel transport system ATP-binding protein
LLASRSPHPKDFDLRFRWPRAAAIALHPKLVLDEPTAPLDVSVQAVVLNLLPDLKASMGHELSVGVARSERGAFIVRSCHRDAGGANRRARPSEQVLGNSQDCLYKELLTAILHSPLPVHQGMVRNNGNRFSETIMRQED